MRFVERKVINRKHFSFWSLKIWTFSVLSKYHVPTKMLVIVLRNLMRFFTKKSCYHQGFFAVKRRAVFILGAMWIALVRGWRRDCVVGGMETRFQWRKAHSRTAKCEAFHIAPRLFFMFFVFDSIHDSATMQNHCPSNFPLRRFFTHKAILWAGSVWGFSVEVEG